MNLLTATTQWLTTLFTIIADGAPVAPRGKPTLELPQHTVAVDLRHPLICVPQRELSEKFAAAEALWILAGDARVEALAKYAPKMREFSDDGITLAGAYGPRILNQIEYVIDTLRADRDTRQATLTIWQPNPRTSKDVPCTVALDFKIRGGKLNCHVFMRSSDAWLGLPYDLFSFAMVTCYILARVNRGAALLHPITGLGRLYLTAASSHLYETDRVKAELVLGSAVDSSGQLTVPEEPLLHGIWDEVEADLIAMREDGKKVWR